MILCVIQHPAGMSAALSRMLHKNSALGDNEKINLKWKASIYSPVILYYKMFQRLKGSFHWLEYVDLWKSWIWHRIENSLDWAPSTKLAS